MLYGAPWNSEEDREIEYCSECGCELDEDEAETGVCDSCTEEQEQYDERYIELEEAAIAMEELGFDAICEVEQIINSYREKKQKELEGKRG